MEKGRFRHVHGNLDRHVKFNSMFSNYASIEAICDKLGLEFTDIQGDVLVIGPASYIPELILLFGCPLCDSPGYRREGVGRVVAVDSEPFTVSRFVVPTINGWNSGILADMVHTEMTSSYLYEQDFPGDKFNVITMFRIVNLSEQLEMGLDRNLSALLAFDGIAILSGG